MIILCICSYFKVLQISTLYHSDKNVYFFVPEYWTVIYEIEIF